MYKRVIGIVLLSWLAMIAWDFFLHGGLLAGFYVADSDFLLAPLEAFQRIPLGYVSFLLLALLLNWLLPYFEISGPKASFVFGLKIGAFIWGALLLGLYSISTIQLSTALAWFVGQSFEMGVGAYVIFLGSRAESLKKLTWQTIAFFLLAIVITLIMQNIGLAPQVII